MNQYPNDVEITELVDDPVPSTSTAVALRPTAGEVVLANPTNVGIISRFYKRKESQYHRSSSSSDLTSIVSRKSKRLSRSNSTQYIIRDEIEEAIFVSENSASAIVRAQQEIQSLAFTKAGKPRSISKGRQKKIEDVNKELEYHKQLLINAQAAIQEFERRNQNLEADRYRTEWQLQAATTAVATANSERERTVQEANAFATNTIAVADAQVTAAQTNYHTAQNKLDAIYQEYSNRQEEVKHYKRQFDEIVADRTKLIEIHHIQITNKTKEIADLTYSLNQSRAETNDFRDQVKNLNDQLDACNDQITNLAGEVNNLRETNEANYKAFQEEVDRLTEELAEANSYQSKLNSSENALRETTRQLNTAEFTLTVLQGQNSKSDNEKAAELASLESALQTAREAFSRQAVNHDDVVRGLYKQIDDQAGVIANLKFAVSIAPDPQELQKLRQENTDLKITINNLKAQIPVTSNTSNTISTSNTNNTMATAGDLSELVAIPLREKIPQFSGYLGEQRVQDWFKAAERVAKGGNWTKDQMKRYFIERFNNLAQTFQEKLDDATSTRRNLSYDDWKKVIIEEFKDPSEAETFKAELRSVRQQERERVRDFAARIEKIFIKGYGETAFKSTNPEMVATREEILKNALQDGLNEDICSGYWNRAKADALYADVIKTATEVESVVRRKAQKGDPNTATISALSLHQEMTDNKMKAMEKEISEIKVSNSSQGNRSKSADISAISTSGNSRDSRQNSRGRSNESGRRVRVRSSESAGGRSYSGNRRKSSSPHPQSRSPSGNRGNWRSSGRRKSPNRGDNSSSSGTRSNSYNNYGNNYKSQARRQLVCYNCGKPGHFQAECYAPKQRGRGRGRGRFQQH